MRTGIRMIAAGLAIAGLGLVAGCGGSSDSAGASSAARTSGGDFVAQANAICAKANTDFQALGGMQSFDNLADFKKRFGQAIEIAKQQYADIAALTPPADITADVAAYVKQGNASVTISQTLYDEVAAGKGLDAAASDTTGTAEGQATMKARREAATAAGLTACTS